MPSYLALSLVTRKCPLWSVVDGVPVMIGHTVEWTPVSIPGASALDEYCVEDPTGCCAEVLPGDCGACLDAFPAVYVADFTNFSSAGPPPIGCLNDTCHLLDGNQFLLRYVSTIVPYHVPLYSCAWYSDILHVCDLTTGDFSPGHLELRYIGGGSPEWRLTFWQDNNEGGFFGRSSVLDSGWDCFGTNTFSAWGAWGLYAAGCFSSGTFDIHPL